MALTRGASKAAMIGLTSLVYLGVCEVDSKAQIPLIGKSMQQFEYRSPQMYDLSKTVAGATLAGSIVGLGYLGLRRRVRE